jgi:hypothetical protein
MKEIANNEYYSIQVDKDKNRMYLTLIGYWKNHSVVPNYVADIQKATQELSRGYTVLTDVTQMKTPPRELADLHTEAQKVIIATGLKKTAELVGQDVIAKMALNQYSNQSGMQKGIFGNKEEAEAWLDEK